MFFHLCCEYQIKEKTIRDTIKKIKMLIKLHRVDKLYGATKL